jgi:hypothetical protein
MLTTTLAVFALAGALSTGANPSPSLQTNYPQALSLAASEHKPLAVFLGQNTSQIKEILANGTIPAEAVKLLRDSYVCVALDSTSGAGKDLADRVKMTEGLIISNSGGSIQALRASGTLTGTDFTRQLDQYTHASTVAGPITAAPAVISGCANGTCRLAAPATTYAPAQPVYNAAPVYGAPVYGSPVYGYPAPSSCPNGRCPLQQPR